MTSVLSPEFHSRKREQLREQMAREGLDYILILNPVNIGYLTGFWHLTTERPLVLGVSATGEDFAIMPRLEVDHFSARVPWLTRMVTFFDYPEGDWQWVGNELVRLGLQNRQVAVDLANLVMTDTMTIYDSLASCLGGPLRNANPLISELRRIKESEELAIFRTAGHFADYLHEVAWNSLETGIREYELHQRLSAAVIEKMLAELPEVVDTNGYSRTIIQGRTLFGASSALPHGPKGARRLDPDSLVMITYGVGVSNYLGETERVGFYGEPTEGQKRMFEIMREAHEAALGAVKPGEPCSSVHQAVVRVVENYGVDEYLKHHTGHGKGLESHEPPYLDPGEHTLMQPGMVFSIEPGLYIPGEGGYRHSDTIVVTDQGAELLTDYPRDLQNLTRPVSG
jgi:Xaa-Pro aminopeptidase